MSVVPWESGGVAETERGEEMSDKCETCRFYDEPLCRRYPPVHQGWDEDTMESFSCFPDAHPEWWCGEHRARPSGACRSEADALRCAVDVVRASVPGASVRISNEPKGSRNRYRLSAQFEDCHAWLTFSHLAMVEPCARVLGERLLECIEEGE